MMNRRKFLSGAGIVGAIPAVAVAKLVGATPKVEHVPFQAGALISRDDMNARLSELYRLAQER